MTKFVIQVVDVAAEVKALFGSDSGESILTEWNMPEDDWRFRVFYGDGSRITFRRGSRAEHVAHWLKANGLTED